MTFRCLAGMLAAVSGRQGRERFPTSALCRCVPRRFRAGDACTVHRAGGFGTKDTRTCGRTCDGSVCWEDWQTLAGRALMAGVRPLCPVWASRCRACQRGLGPGRYSWCGTCRRYPAGKTGMPVRQCRARPVGVFELAGVRVSRRCPAENAWTRRVAQGPWRGAWLGNPQPLKES